jgi:hypothetical protein
MKIAGIGAAVAAIGLGFAIAENPVSRYAAATASRPLGCAVVVEGAPGYLPRAGIAIENARRQPVQASLEPRSGLPRVVLGTFGAGEVRFVAHALPAGRNQLQAAGEEGAVARLVLDVANRGAETCRRRYAWRIE